MDTHGPNARCSALEVCLQPEREATRQDQGRDERLWGDRNVRALRLQCKGAEGQEKGQGLLKRALSRTVCYDGLLRAYKRTCVGTLQREERMHHGESWARARGIW